MLKQDTVYWHLSICVTLFRTSAILYAVTCYVRRQLPLMAQPLTVYSGGPG